MTAEFDLETDFDELLSNLRVFKNQISKIQDCGKMAADALLAGGTIFFCGNGGSAADSQHWAAELTGRFLYERKSISAIALTVDTSAITAIGNDFGFEQIFSRQILGLAKPNDVLIGITTTGNSRNVVEAAKTMKSLGGRVIAFSGPSKGAIEEYADGVINCPGSRTDLIQDLQVLLGHSFCKVVEQLIVENSN
jgi:D-sedoheptulose 7-phosphate isomerase